MPCQLWANVGCRNKGPSSKTALTNSPSEKPITRVTAFRPYSLPVKGVISLLLSQTTFAQKRLKQEKNIGGKYLESNIQGNLDLRDPISKHYLSENIQLSTLFSKSIV